MAQLTLAAGERKEDVLLRRFELFDFYNRPFLQMTLTSKGDYSFRSDAITDLKPEERAAIEKNKPVNFLFSPTGALYSYQEKTVGHEKAPSSDFSRSFSMYLGALSFEFEELLRLFRNLSYIGPLRDYPKRYYEIASEMPTAVGSHGEHMANLVRRRLPEIRTTLNRWVKRFEFGSRLVAKDVSDELFFLAFEDANRKGKTNIADLGFGASQVLPLIVQALTAKKDSLTIAEQPEIHLNPRLQYLLADLLVEMANADRRVIVETHSEHLLLRLRRLVATGKIPHEKVAIYFVEKTEGVSKIRNIPIKENGDISHDVWPKGFFEDSLPESIALAQAQHAKSKQKT